MLDQARSERIAERLKFCRKQSGETLDAIGTLIGVNKSTVMRWEHGDTRRVNMSILRQLAIHYEVNPAWLMGEEDVEMASPPEEERAGWLQRNATPAGEMVRLPVLGSVRAGVGGLVQEEIIDYEAISAAALSGSETCFWLKVTGDSMYPIIQENDLVLIRQQDSVDSGSLAVVIVDDEEGLVKRVVYGDDWIELQSVNPYYPTRRFDGADVLQIRVVGLVLESRRRFT